MDSDEPVSRIKLDIKRGPLIPPEESIEGYYLDEETLKNAPKQKIHFVGHVEPTVEIPAAIFDASNHHMTCEVCYSSRPLPWSDKGSAKTGYVLLVYAVKTDKSRAMLIVDWELVVESKYHAGYPDDYLDRFGDPIWTRP